MNIKNTLLGAALLLGLASATAQATTLAGDTVTGSILFGATTAQGPANAVVGGGLEFDFGNADINVGASDIAITSIAGGTVGQIETYRVEDLDFDDLSAIVGLNLLSFGGLSITPLLSYTIDSVSIALASGTSVGPGAFINVEILTRTSAVPVPAALPLLATGLGALGVAGWRRRRKAAA